MFLESKRGSISFWHDYYLEYGGQYHLIRVRADWSRSSLGGWYSLDLGFLGLNLSLTYYWPKGKGE